jgi:hypothetical protein
MKAILFLQFLLYFIFSTFSFGGMTDIDMSQGGTAASGGANIITKLKGVFYFIPIVLALLLVNKNYFSKILLMLKKHKELFIYIIIVLVELLWAANFNYSLTKLSIFLLSLFSLSSIIIQYEGIYKKTATYHIYNDLSIIGLFLSIILLVLFLIFGSFDLKMRNMFGPWCHANSVAVLSGLFLFFLLHYKTHLIELNLFSPVKANKVHLSIFLMAFIFLVAFSRGAIVAFIFGYIGTRWLSYVWGQSSRAIVVYLVSMIILAGAIVYSEKILKTVSRSQKGEDIASMTGRDLIWAQIFFNLDNQALTYGHGYAALTKKVSVTLERKKIVGAHNTFLQVLAGAGIPGLFFFILYIFSFYRRSKTRVFRSLEINKIDYLAGMTIYLIIFSMGDMIFGLNLSPAFAIFIIVSHATHNKHILFES